MRLSEKLDDEGYKVLREAHITTFVELGENQVFGMIHFANQLAM